MPAINCEQHNGLNYIHCDFAGTWDYADIKPTVQACSRLAAGSTAKAIIIDALDSRSASVMLLDFIGSMIQDGPQALSTFVLVSDDALLHAALRLNETFYDHFNVRVLCVDTTLEAQKLLNAGLALR